MWPCLVSMLDFGGVIRLSMWLMCKVDTFAWILGLIWESLDFGCRIVPEYLPGSQKSRAPGCLGPRRGVKYYPSLFWMMTSPSS